MSKSAKTTVALITGGGSGMGRVMAQKLAAAGAAVAIVDMNEAGMAETAKGYPGIKPYCVDISDTEAVRALVERVEDELGPIDRVANAAAIMPFGKLLEQEARIQLKLMEVNYGGLVNIATATVPRMVERGRGDFISFCSMAGIIPGLLMGGYCSSKAAVQFYTEILYHENRNSGVRFVCVCSSAVPTPLWKQAEATVMPKMVENTGTVTPEEVADAIDKSLDADQFFCFPGKGTRMGYLTRRLIPGTLWNMFHKAEGF